MGDITKITDLGTEEVSLVDRAANKQLFLILKKESARMDEIIAAVLKTPAEGEESVLSKLLKEDGDPKMKAAVMAAMRVLSGFRDQNGEDQFKAIADAVGFELPSMEIEVEAGDKKKENDTGGEKEKSDDNMEGEDAEEMMKSADFGKLPQSIQKSIRRMAESNKELSGQVGTLSAALHVEKDAREDKEYLAKAEKQYSHIGETNEVAQVLKGLNRKDADLAKRVEKLLADAQKRIQAGELLKERGTARGSMTLQADTALDQKVKEAVAKSEGKLTKEQAAVLVLEANPELYQDYLNEKGAQNG